MDGDRLSRGSIEKRYRALAGDYDWWTAAGRFYRNETVRRLRLAAGDSVLDVGCGTGLNFAALEDLVRAQGEIVGIDISPEMLGRAQARIEQRRWRNIRLIQAAAEDFTIRSPVDGALLCGVNDVLRSPVALANVIDQVRPGGQIVAGGPKWVPWWQPRSLVVNFTVWLINQPYVTTFDGFARPWAHLAELLGRVELEEVFAGGGFIATGTVPPPGGRRSRSNRADHRG